jgi:hypothetical protein
MLHRRCREKWLARGCDGLGPSRELPPPCARGGGRAEAVVGDDAGGRRMRTTVSRDRRKDKVAFLEMGGCFIYFFIRV